MTPNDKLPDEMTEQIESEADEATKKFIKEFNIPHREGYYRHGHVDGATAWAPWKVKFDELKSENDIAIQANETLIARMRELNKRMEGERQKHQELQAHAQRMADALGKISNIASWMEETGASRISEIAETALKQRNLGEAEKKEQLIPMAIYKQQGSKTEGKAATDPCPHCGKELSRDRNLCCRECGKEVEDG